MAKASGESLEKLEDMIVRAAESTAAHVRAAKIAIGAVIFGQDLVVERALVTVLSGGHALLVGVPGLAIAELLARDVQFRQVRHAARVPQSIRWEAGRC